jgi:hypothetical protein
MTHLDDSTHDRYRDNLAEFALGILDGRARAELLAHVENCPECAEHLQELSTTVDALIYLPVGVEPPLGFESAIINQIRSSQAAPRRRIARGRRSLAAAAALVFVSFGLGWVVDQAVSTSPTQSNLAAGQMVQRNLESNGRDVGVVYAYPGKSPWMFVTLNSPGAPARVRCTVVTNSGAHKFVGTFGLKSGKGSWGATLPVAPSDIRDVELTSNTGAMIAEFMNTTWSYPPTVTN